MPILMMAGWMFVCSKELTEISGFDFSTENGGAGWRKFERIFKDVYQQNY